VWPEPTHAPANSQEVKEGKKKPWRSAAEIIDWSLPCPSIFDTREAIREKYGLSAQRPLRPNTMRRVIRGVDKFAIKAPDPFLVVVNHAGDFRGQRTANPLHTVTAKDREGVLAANLAKFYGGAYTGDWSKISDPLHTVTAVDHNALAATHLVKMKGTNLGGPVSEPVQTITASGGHFGVVTTAAEKAEPGADLKHWPEIRDLLNTYCGYHLGPEDVILFEIGGTAYFMADIGLRMLTPRELYMANGFPKDYKIERDYTGTVYPKTKQVARCGNAVPPPFATALVRANLPEWCRVEINT